jgi:site-specific DNA-methyltransferase (adenine-specific)
VPREALPRLDTHPDLHAALLPYCRLGVGDIWEDEASGHRVGVIDAADTASVQRLTGGHRYALSVHDPPYNVHISGAAGRRANSRAGAAMPALAARSPDAYLAFSRAWISNAVSALADHAHFYLWTGADQRAGFHPLPELMLLLREFGELDARSMITLRNQRGYGTSRNWMAVRQELLYYTRGTPPFEVQYTAIPRLLRGYYKTVGGEHTENSERNRSPFIRPGNVWVDLQQVFYRLEENVAGAYAQKPLDAVRRIIRSAPTESVLDLFAHSGTTLLAAELEGRRCDTADIDPVFAEISIRRLEHYRRTGRTGWQWHSPFPEAEPG